MKSAFLVVSGVLAAVVGAVWTLQGVGWLGGSPMTGVTLWAIVGPIVMLVGLAGVTFGARRTR